MGTLKIARLLLNGAAVGKDTERIALQVDKVKETEWLHEANMLVFYVHAKFVHFISCVWMRADHHRHLIFRLEFLKCLDELMQPSIDIDIFGAMECDQKIFPRFDLQALVYL